MMKEFSLLYLNVYGVSFKKSINESYFKMRCAVISLVSNQSGCEVKNSFFPLQNLEENN